MTIYVDYRSYLPCLQSVYLNFQTVIFFKLIFKLFKIIVQVSVHYSTIIIPKENLFHSSPVTDIFYEIQLYPY